jgi:hypothetical protein
MRTFARRLALIAVAVAVGTACVEAALRLAGFSFRTYPTVQFGWPAPSEIRDVYVPDRDLFWVTHDYFAELATARRMHPAIVFMGDSCTQFGSYPTMTLTRLNSREPSLGRRGLVVGAGARAASPRRHSTPSARRDHLLRMERPLGGDWRA